MENVHFNEMLNRAMDYCSRSEKCEFDVRKKLRDWNADNTVIEDVIDALYADQFIDHKRYVKAFVNDAVKLKLWGRIKIRSNLKVKSICSEIITEALSQIDEEEYLNKIIYLIQTRHRHAIGNDESRYKIVKSLYSRGYESEIVLKAIDFLKENPE